MKPSHLPEIRDRIHGWCQGEQAHLVWRKAARIGQYAWVENLVEDHDVNFSHPSEDDLDTIASRMRGGLLNTLDSAILYWVNSEMSQLIRAASKTVPDFALQPHDLPARSGFMVFENPPAERGNDQQGVVGLHAVSWQTWHSMLILTCFTSHADMEPVVRDQAPGRWPQFSQEPEIIPLIGQEAAWGFGISTTPAELVGEYGDTRLAASMAAAKTAWLLLQQEITISTATRPDRASRRRLERAGRPVPPVRIISLRRRKHQPGTGDPDREFHHQWIVRGHWRSQWYPSRQVHRPVWITPHVKGPEGAPMLGGEKVNALVR